MVALGRGREAKDSFAQVARRAVAVYARDKLMDAHIFGDLLRRKRDSTSEAEVKALKARALDVFYIRILLHYKKRRAVAAEGGADVAQPRVAALKLHIPPEALAALRGALAQVTYCLRQVASKGRSLGK